MVLDHSVGAKSFRNLGPVIVFQITGSYAANCDISGIEVGRNVVIQHINILIVGSDSDMRTIIFNPFCDMLGKKGVDRFD